MKQSITLTLFLVMVAGIASAQVPYRYASPDANVISKSEVLKAKAKIDPHVSNTRDIYEMFVDYDAANFDDLYYVWRISSSYTSADTALNYSAVVLNNIVGYTDPNDPVGTYVDWSFLGLDDSFPDNVLITIDSIFFGGSHENNSAQLDYIEMRIVKVGTNGAPNNTSSGILWSQKDSVDYTLSPGGNWVGDGALIVLGYGPEYTPAPGQMVAASLYYTDPTKSDTFSVLGGCVDDGSGGALDWSLYGTSWMRYPPFIPSLSQNVNIGYDTNGDGTLDKAFEAQNWVYWFRVTINTVVGIADNFDNLKVTGITPNPTSGRTNILYGLNEAAHVNIDLYDISGRFISHLYDGNDGVGSYIRNLDVTNLSNGTYFISTQAGNGTPVVSKFVVSH